MRHITIDERRRQPVVIIEGMPRTASLQYLGKGEDLLYLVERSDEGFRLHIGERALTPAHIQRSYSAVDIGAHVLSFSHEYARGELFFTETGSNGFIYHAGMQGNIIGQENLVTVLSRRPRDASFSDVQYKNTVRDYLTEDRLRAI